MLTAVTMVRDEADVIGLVLAHLLAEGVDRIIVADNGSDDGTEDILAAYAELHPVTVLEDADPAYRQSEKMTHLANVALEMGADWVLPFDADEVFYTPGWTLRDWFKRQPDDVGVVMARGWDHIATHGDPQLPNPLQSMVHRRAVEQRLSKVAFRAEPEVVVDWGNHDVFHHPGGRTIGGLRYRHFQYRSWSQFQRKVRQGKAAYDAIEGGAHQMYGTHWRLLGGLDDESLRARWDALCAEGDLVYDPAPVRSL